MNRRRFLTGLGATLATPAIVRAASLDALPRGAILVDEKVLAVAPLGWGDAQFSRQWAEGITREIRRQTYFDKFIDLGAGDTTTIYEVKYKGDAPLVPLLSI